MDVGIIQRQIKRVIKEELMATFKDMTIERAPDNLKFMQK